MMGCIFMVLWMGKWVDESAVATGYLPLALSAW